MSYTIAVTGATGCVGTALVRHLAARGVGVRALLRVNGSTRIGLAGVDEVRGDLFDPDYLARALDGVDVVVHLAAIAHPETGNYSAADYQRVNVRAAEHVYQASCVAGAGRFVLVSSDLVMGDSSAGSLREDQACRPAGGYALSKLMAEMALERLAARGGPALVVLRPSVVYGEADRGSFARLLRALSRGRFVLPGRGRTRLSICYAGNLALALELAATHAAAAGRTYLVSDEPSPTLAEIVTASARAIGAETGRSVRIPVAPLQLLYPFAVVGQLLTSLGVPAPLTTDTLRRLTTERVHDLARIRTELGYRPRYTLAEGLKRSVSWLFADASSRREGRTIEVQAWTQTSSSRRASTMDGDLQPRGVHLVGSLPLASSSDVFRTAGEILGQRLLRLPDGETGKRSDWIRWQMDVFTATRGLEMAPPSVNAYVERPQVQVCSESRSADITFGPLGYAQAARDSYAQFERLKEEGVIAQSYRFQVSLPTPLAVVNSFVARKDRAALEPAYERRLLAELDEITQVIPHEHVAVQWDVAIEIGILEGIIPSQLTDPRREIIDRLVRLGNRVPGDVELGYHLCYGDAGHRHFKQPEDTGLLVYVAQALSAAVARPIQWIHLPVPRERSDDAFFAPLRSLRLHPETRLFLGLVHYTDGVVGTQRRIEAARRTCSDFGVATECGMGRRPPETIPDLLRIHAQVSAPA